MTGGLSASLLAVLGDEERRQRLADLDEAALAGIAHRLVGRDAYGSNAHLGAALSAIGARSAEAIHQHVEHQLWCGWREARYRCGRPPEFEAVLVGAGHLRPTAQRPTVLLVPMTLAIHDATRAVLDLAGERPFIMYGEGLWSSASSPPPQGRFAGPGLKGLAEIISVLDGGGVFATFADFVYSDHRHEPMTLFGRPHPVSSAFIGLLGRPRTIVLPLICVRRGGRIDVVLRDAWPVGDAETDTAARVAGVSGRLEQLIRLAPTQWLLAPTLTFESPQAPLPQTGDPDGRTDPVVTGHR